MKLKKELLDALYREQYDFLLKYITGHMRYLDIDTAEDIIQDAFYEMVRKSEGLGDHPNLCGWLTETVKRKMISYYRKASTSEVKMGEEWPDQGLTQKEYELLENKLFLEQAASMEERELLTRHYIEGYPLAQLAKEAGISEGAMKVKLLRIRKKIRESI